MPPISHASDLLEPGQKALAVFTNGKRLIINPDGSGQTGNWKLDRKRGFDRLIFYKRTAGQNEVYVADRTEITDSDEEGRSVVHFANAESAGTTELNWRAFAGGHTNPVRYLGYGKRAA